MGRSTRRREYRALVARLKAARLKVQMTQQSVADALGTTQVFISRVERAQRRIDPIELAEFAAIYQTTVNALLPDVALGAERRQRIETVVDLSRDEYQRLLAQAESLGQSPESLIAEMVVQYAHTPEDLD